MWHFHSYQWYPKSATYSRIKKGKYLYCIAYMMIKIPVLLLSNLTIPHTKNTDHTTELQYISYFDKIILIDSQLSISGRVLSWCTCLLVIIGKICNIDSNFIVMITMELPIEYSENIPWLLDIWIIAYTYDLSFWGSNSPFIFTFGLGWWLWRTTGEISKVSMNSIYTNNITKPCRWLLVGLCFHSIIKHAGITIWASRADLYFLHASSDTLQTYTS